MNDQELKEFTELRMLLNSDSWPVAVDPALICNIASEEDKVDRSIGILTILELNDLNNFSLLDFGCGEGHVTMNCDAKFAVGYDINKFESELVWENIENNKLLTTNIEKVKEYAPYDRILIYDVLDHVENPIDILKQTKSLLADDGKIILRCHPFCGRHGGHLYQQINKAFVHLVFTNEELNKLGFNMQKLNKVIYPLKTYGDYFIEVGLKSEYSYVERSNIEEFFIKNDLIKSRLMQIWDRQIDGSFPKFQMEQCFVDYVLVK